MILYEYPLNERVRTLLRLEDLFVRLDYFCHEEHPLAHHVALVTLFELLEVAARADLKSDLLQELERQRQTLLGYRSNPQVSSTALEQVLAEVDSAWNGLSQATGRTGQHIRDNEWLMSIRSRTNIAGGACEFDLPSYFAWQNHPAVDRQADINAWAGPFRPLESGVSVVLKMLRESAQLASRAARPQVALVAASCHDAGELARAAELGCDFAVLGPVRATASHPGATPLGWSGFEALVRGTQIPAFALGGVSPGDEDRARAAGAHGLAMLRGAWPPSAAPDS